MLAVTLVVSLIAARRPDRLTILVGLAVLAIAFYVVPTRVHERYAYPAFALAIILAAVAWRWRLAYVALTVTVFLNMYAALTNPFYNNPGISDWLGIGPTIRGEWGVTSPRRGQRRHLPVGAGASSAERAGTADRGVGRGTGAGGCRGVGGRRRRSAPPG